jgi:transcription antitermination factor NusG
MVQPSNLYWYVLYTKPRHEKFVESSLLERGIEAFTPKVRLKKRWSDRVMIVEEPIFKSYCFARFSLTDKSKIISQKGVSSVIHFNRHYIPVADSVINSLKILIDNQLQLDPCPYLKIGKRVVIKSGPLKGLEGFIIEKRNKNTTLVVSVDAIAASVKCVVYIDCVDLA